MTYHQNRTNEGRKVISQNSIDSAMVDLRARIEHAFAKHGHGQISNSFEALGILQLELDEFKKSIQDREGVERHADELLDVATVAIVTVASIYN